MQSFAWLNQRCWTWNIQAMYIRIRIKTLVYTKKQHNRLNAPFLTFQQPASFCRPGHIYILLLVCYRTNGVLWHITVSLCWVVYRRYSHWCFWKMIYKAVAWSVSQYTCTLTKGQFWRVRGWGWVPPPKL